MLSACDWLHCLDSNGRRIIIRQASPAAGAVLRRSNRSAKPIVSALKKGIETLPVAISEDAAGAASN